MRFAVLTTLGVCAGFATVYAAAPQDPVRILATSPLRFEPSAGGRKFVAGGLKYRFQFEGNRALLQADGKSVGLRFKGASTAARIEPSQLMRSTTNILHGSDRSQWRMAIPNYGRLQVQRMYPGIDVAYYGNGEQLEYDLTVHAGTNPSRIRMAFDGVRAHIDREGNLVAAFMQRAPVAYQLAGDGTRVPVDSHYRRNADGTFGFTLGRYDRSRDLVIDPVITFGLWLWGSQQDSAQSIGHDSKGLVYVAGTTYSGDFNIAGNDTQPGFTGTSDVFLAQMDPTQPAGSQILFSTYIGGSLVQTLADMYVAPNSMVYLTGNTTSNDFPNLNGAQTTIDGNSDAFATAIDASTPGTATLTYSTFLGGSSDDYGNGITADSKGKIYVTGTTLSTDLPTLNALEAATGAPQTAFVTAIDPSQSGAATIVYETFLGGGVDEIGNGITVAPDGTIWVVGATYSPDFPVANGPYQASYNPGGRGFVAQIDTTQSGLASLLYATYLGGSDPNGPDGAKKVAIDPSGNVVVAGYAGSDDFPVTQDALQAVYGGMTDAFITVLNPKNASNQLVYSTFYGGSQPDIAEDLKVDLAGNIYVSGFTMSPDLYVTGNALTPATTLTLNGFALEFTPSRPSLGGVDFASYIGGPGSQIAYGIDYDPRGNGNIYLAGFSTSVLMDQYGGQGKNTGPGNEDAWVMAINACGYALPFASEQFPVGGGSNNIAISASTAGCTWTASSPVSWITVSPASGTGNGTVTVTVAPNNTGSGRQATISIAGLTFLVGQD